MGRRAAVLVTGMSGVGKSTVLAGEGAAPLEQRVGGRASTAVPAAVVAAVAAVRPAFDHIHVMHECDQDCSADCDRTDYSESA
jgi:hypothetical protein